MLMRPWRIFAGVAVAITLSIIVFLFFQPVYISECYGYVESGAQACYQNNVLNVALTQTMAVVVRAEFWTALATIAIAYFTYTLKQSNDNLWSVTKDTLDHAEETSKRELRAYIGMQNNGTTFDVELNPGNQRWEENRGPVKIFTLNYGKTPAHNATMYVHIVGLPLSEAINDDLCTKVAGPQIIHPGQNFGKIVGGKKGADQFFIYGFVDYTDAFEEKWRYRFAFSHDPNRFFSASKNDRWIAHSEHNDEQKRN